MPEAYTLLPEPYQVGMVFLGFLNFVRGLLSRFIRVCCDEHGVSLLCPPVVLADNIAAHRRVQEIASRF